MSQVGGIDVEIKKQSSVCKQMRFSIGRTSLLSTLTRVSGVVERRNAIDILACINIKAQHGSIKLMATDLDISIFASLAADVSTEGEVKVSAHTLHDIVKKLPADLDVNFEVNEFANSVTSLSSEIVSLLLCMISPGTGQGERKEKSYFVAGRKKAIKPTISGLRIISCIATHAPKEKPTIQIGTLLGLCS